MAFGINIKPVSDNQFIARNSQSKGQDGGGERITTGRAHLLLGRGVPPDSTIHTSLRVLNRFPGTGQADHRTCSAAGTPASLLPNCGGGSHSETCQSWDRRSAGRQGGDWQHSPRLGRWLLWQQQCPPVQHGLQFAARSTVRICYLIWFNLMKTRNKTLSD